MPNQPPAPDDDAAPARPGRAGASPPREHAQEQAHRPGAPEQERAANPEGPWREEEKSLGAGLPGQSAGEAGEASNKGRPNDQREQMEGAAAGIVEDVPAPPADTPAGRPGSPRRARPGEPVTDRRAPHPDTVVVRDPSRR